MKFSLKDFNFAYNLVPSECNKNQSRILCLFQTHKAKVGYKILCSLFHCVNFQVIFIKPDVFFSSLRWHKFWSKELRFKTSCFTTFNFSIVFCIWPDLLLCTYNKDTVLCRWPQSITRNIMDGVQSDHHIEPSEPNDNELYEISKNSNYNNVCVSDYHLLKQFVCALVVSAFLWIVFFASAWSL